MGGGLMQLVAYGAQDIYLTGNPQITFFKVVYRRHTNFSMESIEQTFNGSVANGNRVTATVSRNGDLIHRMWLQASVTVSGSQANVGTYKYFPQNVGHQLIKEVELEVGGQRVDKQYADWMQVWSDLSVSSEHKSGYAAMTGGDSSIAAAGTNSSLTNKLLAVDSSAQTLYVPLQFWFCRNPGLALPLIALQYHEVKVNMTFGAELSAVGSNTADSLRPVNVDGAIADGTNGKAATVKATLSSASLWVDYIYLDTDERRRFAQVSHEYLIEQVQFTGDESMTANSTNNVRLNFNHPVKELVWVQKSGTTGLYAAMADSTKLQLNGHDRFAERPAMYFTHVQPYQHHTNIPSGNVNVYSFALKPEEHQPSGTCNFSRIDNATLSVTTASSQSGALKVFAVNYNVLRVMSGMGGLAYSN